MIDYIITWFSHRLH